MGDRNWKAKDTYAPLPFETDPNNPVVRELSSQWHKLCAVVMMKAGLRELVITGEDVEALVNSGTANILADTRGGGRTITLRLVTDAEARELSRQQKGKPQ